MKLNAKYVVFSVIGVMTLYEIVQAIIWSCLALSVVLADVSIHWKEIRAASSARVKSRVVVKKAIPDPLVQTT